MKKISPSEALILNKSGLNAFNYISRFVNPEAKKTLVVATTNNFSIDCHEESHNAIVNLSRINDIRYINKFFEHVNSKSEMNDVFICCLETFSSRRRRKTIGKIPFFGKLYFLLEFIFMRVFPKVSGLKKIYFSLTRGRNRLLSKAEALGRLVCCGFEIVDCESIDGLLYIVTRKIKEPAFDMHPSYGLLYKMPRLGRNGDMIGVYKFRTMHPYAEYLQDYVLKMNGYAESGKPKDDFRLTPWGKILRRYWLDELPQLLNVLKGELKIVGVRPISKRYFQDVPKDLQILRLRQKPGCIPPYVALNRHGNVTSVLQAEREYLTLAINHSIVTDFHYFFMALYNILVKNKRSA
jgi:lipopolysaccharide/colanic/teichoic acid biosynthesis glycosyltransferase